jgi:segregation and condensation protein A
VSAEISSVAQPLTEREGITLERSVALPAPFLFRRLPVQLPDYEGSAELLVWLLRRQLVEVGEVSVSAIAQQIQAAIDGAKGCDGDKPTGRDKQSNLPLTVAEEVAIAAELVWLKSALLLPQPEEVEAPEPEEAEEGESLKQRLLRHAAYGLAAKFLAERGKVWSQMFPRPIKDEAPNPVRELVLGDNPSALLLEALRRVLARMAGMPIRPPRRLTVPQRLRMLLQILKSNSEGVLSFDALCADCQSLLEVIITFLAVLELIRRGIVSARQDEPFGPILLFLRAPTSG